MRPRVGPGMRPSMRLRMRSGVRPRPGMRPSVRLRLGGERVLAGCLHDGVQAALEGRGRSRCYGALDNTQELSPDGAGARPLRRAALPERDDG